MSNANKTYVVTREEKPIRNDSGRLYTWAIETHWEGGLATTQYLNEKEMDNLQLALECYIGRHPENPNKGETNGN